MMVNELRVHEFASGAGIRDARMRGRANVRIRFNDEQTVTTMHLGCSRGKG